MAKINTVLLKLREKFVQALREEFAAKFESRQIETTFNIIYSCYVSTPADGEPFTPEQIAFIAGFEKAWMLATHVVSEEA